MSWGKEHRQALRSPEMLGKHLLSGQCVCRWPTCETGMLHLGKLRPSLPRFLKLPVLDYFPLTQPRDGPLSTSPSERESQG